MIGIDVDEFRCRKHARWEADRVVALLVKNRDEWTCQSCSATQHTTSMEWAHVLGRNTAPVVRWDLDAAITLCYRCHADFTANPTRWHVFVARRSPGLIEELRARQQERAGAGIDLAAVIVTARLQLGEAA